MNEQKTINDWLSALILFLLGPILISRIVSIIFGWIIFFLPMFLNIRMETIQYTIVALLFSFLINTLSIWIGIIIFKKILTNRNFVSNISRTIKLATLYFILFYLISLFPVFFGYSKGSEIYATFYWILLGNFLVIIIFYFLCRIILKVNNPDAINKISINT